jgi:hypothetical protein
MKDNGDVNYIVGELRRYRSHDQIVTVLCERRGYKWEKASNLVRFVESEHADEIAKQRLPFLVFFSAGMIFFGIFAVTSSIYTYAIGEIMPMTITLFIVSWTHPNNGQLVLSVIGLLAIISGIAGVILAIHRAKSARGL